MPNQDSNFQLSKIFALGFGFLSIIFVLIQGENIYKLAVIVIGLALIYKKLQKPMLVNGKIKFRIPSPHLRTYDATPNDINSLSLIQRPTSYLQHANLIDLQLIVGTHIYIPLEPINQTLPFLHQLYAANPQISIDEELKEIIFLGNQTKAHRQLAQKDYQIGKKLIFIIITIVLYNFFLALYTNKALSISEI